MKKSDVLTIIALFVAPIFSVLNPSLAQAHYLFLPSPGHHHGAQYENITDKHGGILCPGDGRCYCVSAVNQPLDPSWCDYWTAITFHKGKMDRNEALVIGAGAAFGLGDALGTAHKISQGCEEIGSLGLLPRHPSVPQLVGFQVLMQLPAIIVAEKTPLYYSTAPELSIPELLWARGSWRAMKHNAKIVCDPAN